MPDFSLTDEQQAFRRLAHEFAMHEIIPVAEHYDRTAEYPFPVIEKAHEVGLTNLNVPAEYGGPGVGLFEEVLIGEELSWGCTGISGVLGINTIATLPLLIAGTDEQKRNYLGRLVNERQLAAYAVTEPNGGSDVAAMQTKAERVGDEYILNGTKQFITNASYAHWYVVFAVTDRAARHKGISAFLVEREQEGVQPGRKDDKMGQRASNTAQLMLEDVRVHKTNLLGAEGDAFKIAMQTFNHSRPGVAIAAVGLARRALEEAVSYALDRKTFGVPIAEHQAIQFKIADMAMEIEAARMLSWRAAWLADRGERGVAAEAAMAKCYSADMAVRAVSEALQIFGGYGYVKDYVIEKLYRDAKVFQIYEGTSEIQRMIIARHVVDGARRR